jgi:hypothetical protein
MRSFTAIALATFIFTFQSFAQTQVKKYDIKSGIVTYNQVMKVGSMEMKKKVIIYFDDYGIKENRETFDKDKLIDSYFSDGNFVYAIKHGKKVALKKEKAYNGVGILTDWHQFGTEKDIQSGKIKIKPAMTVVGKSCDVFETRDKDGKPTAVYAGWKKVLMYMSTKSSYTDMEQKAIKFEENANIPADKFKVPSDYTIDSSQMR